MKHIVIKNCMDCPYKGRSKSPYCGFSGLDIPTKVDYNDLGIPVVEAPIPEWCELDDYYIKEK